MTVAGEEPVVGEGGCVAVYDLGGGTFDTAILRREGGGFRLAGPPGGLDWFGGEDFDQRLYDWVLGRVYELDVEVWRELSEPQLARAGGGRACSCARTCARPRRRCRRCPT